MGTGFGQRSDQSKVNTCFLPPEFSGARDALGRVPETPAGLALRSSLSRKVVFSGHSLQVREVRAAFPLRQPWRAPSSRTLT